MFNYRIENVFSKDGKNYDWHQPNKVAISNEGNVYVLDTQNKKVLMYDSDMHLVSNIKGGGVESEMFETPIDIKIGNNNLLYILDYHHQKIFIFNKDGKFVRSIRIPQFSLAFTVDVNENIFINSPRKDGSIMKLDKDGNYIKSFGPLLEKENKKFVLNWAFLEYDQTSKIIVASYQYFPVVQIFSSEGTLVKEFELNSVSVQELRDAPLCDWAKDKFAAKIFTVGITIHKGVAYNLISYSDSQPLTLYLFELSGTKISEIPLLDNKNKPISLLMSISSNDNNLYLSAADGNIYVLKMNN